jgi:hypothetical protein
LIRCIRLIGIIIFFGSMQFHVTNYEFHIKLSYSFNLALSMLVVLLFSVSLFYIYLAILLD